MSSEPPTPFVVSQPPNRSAPVLHGLLLVGIVALALLFYAPLVGTWFFNDDPHWVGAAASHGLIEMVTVPEVFRALTPNFTPWLAATFEMDVAMFGLNPIGYHLHDLLSLALLSAALAWTAGLWMSRTAALVAVLLLWASPVTMATATWPATRHYVEGLLFALLALRIYSSTRGRWTGAVGAGVLYFLAASAKEVYVVLPLVAVLLAPGSLRSRLYRSLPMWAALAAYTGWHLWIMGGIGGYASNLPLSLSSVWLLIQSTVRAFARFWFSGDLWPVVILGTGLVAASVIPWRGIGSLGPILAFLVVLSPLLPIAQYSESRYVFHLSVFLILGIAGVFDRLWVQGSGARAVALAVLGALLAVFSVQDQRLNREIRSARAFSKAVAARFVEADGWVQAEHPLYFYEGLRKAYRSLGGRELRARLLPPPELLRFATPERLARLRSEGAPVPYEEIEAFQSELATGPISVQFTLQGYELRWQFGPIEDQDYVVLLGPEEGLYFVAGRSLPAQGRFLLSSNASGFGHGRLVLRTLYRTEAGRTIVAPEVALEVPGQKTVTAEGVEQ